MATKVGAREWYRIRCEAGADVAEIWIYDVIGETMDFLTGETSGVSAKKFAADLQALPDSVKTLRVHVNSPGGDWAESIAIANTLRAQSREKGRSVEILIEAIAASGASLITSAGAPIKIASNAVVMVHNPQGMLRVIGEAKDMRSAADSMIAAMDAIRATMVTTYRWVSQLSAEAIEALMDATTWMGAEEAVANGFASEIMDPIEVTAHHDPRSVKALGEIPEAYRERVELLTQKSDRSDESDRSDSDPDIPGILAECKAAGCLDLAEDLIAAKATREEARARATEAKEIRGLCAAAKLPELAEGYIRARVAVADVKAQLTIITAKMDAVEIVTSLPADGDRAARTPSRLNPSAIYAERNARRA